MTTKDCADINCDHRLNEGGRAHVRDNETGLEYCGAMCWHACVYGIRPPITMGEDTAFRNVKAWEQRHPRIF